jgi:hypothetical protein
LINFSIASFFRSKSVFLGAHCNFAILTCAFQRLVKGEELPLFPYIQEVNFLTSRMQSSKMVVIYCIQAYCLIDCLNITLNHEEEFIKGIGILPQQHNWNGKLLFAENVHETLLVTTGEITYIILPIITDAYKLLISSNQSSK